MKILAIETSCDETAIAILECSGNPSNTLGAGEHSAEFKVLGNALLSQIELHKKYGGVFPALAKREHAKNLTPILEAALEEAELLREDAQIIPEKTRAKISEILAREPELCEPFLDFISESERPSIDAIAVTAGPGLEPALWVGINFAKALALAWEKPLVAVNHMEGHILAALSKKESGETLTISDMQFPILALLISGGHTQLVVMKEWLKYELVGETRDDAVGEAFDKVARMLGLPYPGGPEISKLAEAVRSQGFVNPSSDDGFTKPLTCILPRPMIREDNCDFSFAGLKTAILYLLKKIPNVSDEDKKHIAHEFENAVADVLWKKTSRAISETGAKTLVIGGGVSANKHIRRVFTEKINREYPEIALHIPVFELSTDNAIMIALAGYYRALRKEFKTDFIANGNLSLA
jgi:N6-L-threonylcarbamoyladenine synthase